MQIEYRYNQYPANYEEENLPKLIIEIRYNKGNLAGAAHILGKLEATGQLPMSNDVTYRS